MHEVINIKALSENFTVCKLSDISKAYCVSGMYFLSSTDEEISLVCVTEQCPEDVLCREDGWKGFRICGILEFSLIGILAKISGLLADKSIPVFAISTYNTDYILVKNENFQNALDILSDAGYCII